MEIFHSLDDFQETRRGKIALTIGNFDGLHQGHRHLLKILKEEANKLSLPTAVLTFKQHTSVKTTPENPKTILTNIEQKVRLIKDLSLIDFLILQDFNDDFKSTFAEDFIERVLVKKLKIGLIVLGENHRFGKDRVGDLKLLKNKSLLHGFNAIAVDLLKVNGQIVSSTLLREKLQ